VAEILADPSLVDSLPGLTKDQRRLLRRFQIAWDLPDARSRIRLLPEIVERVANQEADYSTLKLRLDLDGLTGILSKCQSSSGRALAGRCEAVSHRAVRVNLSYVKKRGLSATR